MSIRKPLIGFSLFAIVSILVTSVIWTTLQRSVDTGTHTYSAIFRDVLGLKAGDDVRMAGVRVGRVNEITLLTPDEKACANKELESRTCAKVTFIADSDQHLFNDTKALVRYQNLIGQRYVALARGEGSGDFSELRAGGTIPIERTESSFDISKLLGGFQPLFDALRPEQVNRLSETLILALQGDSVSLANFITQAAGLAREFKLRDQIFADVIVNLSGVMAGLAKRGSELETLVTQTRALIGGLYSQGQSLQASVTQVAGATAALTGLVGQIQPQLATAQTSATSALQLLVANGARLDNTAVDATQIFADAARFTSEQTAAIGYLCRLDVSLWGVLFPRGLISQIGGNSQSGVCR